MKRSGVPTLDRITVEPGKMNGQPCIRGMRITVKRVVLAVATYGTGEALRRAYPDLDDEDIRQALEYAASNLEDGSAVTVNATSVRVHRLPLGVK